MRYLYMEAGHIAENIELEAVSLGLVSVPVAGFNDSAVQKVLVPKPRLPILAPFLRLTLEVLHPGDLPLHLRSGPMRGPPGRPRAIRTPRHRA